MSLSWQQRKARLASLLKNPGDDDGEALALDRLMHGQNVIGKTSKTIEVDSLRFQNKDLNVVGTLEYGQFGKIDVVTCRLNNAVYIRKSIDKRFALRAKDQCFPQHERDLLLQARKSDSAWAPHLLCAFQTPTHLNLVMDYAEGGNLWDVLESSPHDGRILESDLAWWAPQIVSAIHWCHSQGFAHRDIKPHNFVLTPTAHILLIDFGSAAPLLPPNADGSQLLPKRYCLVPCGTCDYVSPEILQAHEQALVEMEMEDEDDGRGNLNGGKGDGKEEEGYGVETDWWSFGAMLYEMVYGVAPFFAGDVRQTYNRIMNHERSLKFDKGIQISPQLQHFLHRLLTNAKHRLGRRNVMEITDHPVFEAVNWRDLNLQPAPSDLHLPQFTYNAPPPATNTDDNNSAPEPEAPYDETSSQPFPFSIFFQPSSNMSHGVSVLRPSPSRNGNETGNVNTGHAALRMSTGSSYLRASLTGRKDDNSAMSFIGFSWGPPHDAFPSSSPPVSEGPAQGEKSMFSFAPPEFGFGEVASTPRPLSKMPATVHQTPLPVFSVQRNTNTLSVPSQHAFSTPRPLPAAFMTPLRFTSTLGPGGTGYVPGPVLRTGTIRRTAPRRSVSDREAMKMLVDCVGMSARKKVLESGRKPRLLDGFGGRFSGGTMNGRSGGGQQFGNGGEGSQGGGTRSRSGSTAELKHQSSRKELRFDPMATPIPKPDYSGTGNSHSGRSKRGSGNFDPNNTNNTTNPLLDFPPVPGTTGFGFNHQDQQQYVDSSTPPSLAGDFTDTDTETESEGAHPPSPSPSPRPGSAMSMMSISRRSVTPSVSGYFRSTTPTVSGYLTSTGTFTRMRSGSGSGLGFGLNTGRSTTSVATSTSTTKLSAASNGSGSGSGESNKLPQAVQTAPTPVEGDEKSIFSTANTTRTSAANTTATGVLKVPDKSIRAGDVEFRLQPPPGMSEEQLTPLERNSNQETKNGAGISRKPLPFGNRPVPEGPAGPPIPKSVSMPAIPTNPPLSSFTTNGIKKTHVRRASADALLGDMERRHTRMMRDIEELEERFETVLRGL
ncbi:kinase-like domain-containing protein [Panaeolus papilionaceus]|nr:kinase-like domain-containing protein [Panaeolus papilionaceus]